MYIYNHTYNHKNKKFIGKIFASLEADKVRLYHHNIPHGLCLHCSLKKRIHETSICKVPVEEILLMAEFVLKATTLSLMKNFCKVNIKKSYWN